MNSKDIKTYNLSNDTRILYRLELKPTFLLVVSMLIGFILVIPFTSIGVVIISIASYCLVFLPSRVLLEFHDDYVIFYNKASHEDCVMIYYEDIMKWRYIKGRKVDYLVVELEDGTRENIECFNYRAVTRYMRMFAADREVKKKKTV